jgi:DNA polymerase-3 subunit delta
VAAKKAVVKRKAGGRSRTAADPLDAVTRGELAPVYFICGEPFARDRMVAAVRRQVVGEKASAFNFDALDGKENTARDILAAARTMPMLGGKRLIQVREADALGAEGLNGLLPYVADPSPFSVVLLVAEKADMRLKAFSQIKKVGVVHRYEALKERQVAAWLKAEAKRDTIKLAAGAAERIADAVGTDMGQLYSALERLSLYVGGRAIEIADVEELLAETRQRSIFELTNAVGRGDRREAMLVLRRMLRAREPALRIVAMLSRHVRQLWVASELSGRSQQDIAEAVGVHPFFVKDIIAQARRFDVAMLQKTHRALYEVDRSLKSSRLPAELQMERLVLSLCP